MILRLYGFIYLCFISTITLQMYYEEEPKEFLVTNISLKCPSESEEFTIPVTESVGFYFEEHFPARGYLGKLKRYKCFWLFKPLNDRNYVELYFQTIKPYNECNFSSIEISVSGLFTERICNVEIVENSKFHGKNISLRYNYLRAPNTSYRLEIIVRETSPVNPGCDFKTREIGYRYHLLYELSGKDLPTTKYGQRPMQGAVLSHVPFSLTLVNEDNIGVTPCFDDLVILPNEDIPSCHSAIESNCEWEIDKAISLVYEVTDLKGYHWKIKEKGIFKSKSRFLEFDAICLYLEYMVDNPNDLGIIKVFAVLPHGKMPLTENILQSEMWDTIRIVSPLPKHLKHIQIQLLVDITINGVLYVNKIYGCNPFTLEDRYSISTGTNIYLFGSVEIEFIRSNQKCKNGGVLLGNHCVCAIGFRGENCESACGENKFGLDCGSYCSLFNYGCKQMIFCDDIMGCSCAAGFCGEFCQIGCSDHDYGTNCEQKCGLCFNNTPCDSFTGRCSSGCQYGYIPPFCKISYQHFIKPPNITSISYQEVTVEANILSDTVDGSGVPSSYVIEYKLSDTKIWKYGLSKEIPKDDHIVTVLKNLKSDKVYNLRIILLVTGTKESFNEKVPFVTFQTLCRAYIKFIIKVEQLWTSGAKISWEKEIKDPSDCNILEYDIYITSGPNWKKFRVNETKYTFLNLLSGTKYVVRIKPILNEKSPYSYFSFTTLPKCSNNLLSIEVSNIGSNKADIKWELGPDKYAKYMSSYMCTKIVADPLRDCSFDQGKIITAKNKYTLNKLHPKREYLVTVKDDACPDGTDYQTRKFTTLGNVPNTAPVDIISIVQSTRTNFKWSTPNDCSECNGIISGYHVEVMDSKSSKKLFTDFVKDPIITLEGLLPGKSYIFQVFLVNENGWNNSSAAALEFTTLT